jgi:hypothetical protein
MPVERKVALRAVEEQIEKLKEAWATKGMNWAEKQEEHKKRLKEMLEMKKKLEKE